MILVWSLRREYMQTYVDIMKNIAQWRRGLSAILKSDMILQLPLALIAVIG